MHTVGDFGLARLHEKLPSEEEAAQMSEGIVPWPLRLRQALRDFIHALYDPTTGIVWSNLTTERRNDVIGRLRHTAIKYYQQMSSSQQPDSEFKYLYSILDAFHRDVQSGIEQGHAYEIRCTWVD